MNLYNDDDRVEIGYDLVTTETTQIHPEDNCLCEEDFYPPNDNRIYDGIKGNVYDDLIEYRKDYFNYINDDIK